MVASLVQMSGVPGSGKSTIAVAIAPALQAIVLDHDDTKSAILEVGIGNDLAGQVSYSVIKALARRYISEGKSVIIDSPCLYTPLLEYGLEVARRYEAVYRYIECRLEDVDLIDTRLRQRHSRRSQMSGVEATIAHRGNLPRESRALIQEWANNMKRPEGDYLVLDASQPAEDNIERALEYVRA